MRAINNLRIGTKLMIASGLAIVMVAAMIFLQISGGGKILAAMESVERQSTIVGNALDAKASGRGMQMGLRDVLIAYELRPNCSRPPIFSPRGSLLPSSISPKWPSSRPWPRMLNASPNSARWSKAS